MLRFQPFLEHLSTAQRAPATIREYRYALSALERYVSDFGVKDDRAVTREHIAAFIKVLRERVSSDDYAAKVAGMLKAYFGFLVDRGLLLYSPMEGWRARRAGLGHFPVQRLLGHVDIRTTVIYLRVSEHALRSRVTESHPRLKWPRENKRRQRRVPS